VSRSAVYAAEDQWSAVLERGGVIDFFGSRLDVPAQRRFGDVPSVQRYLAAVLELPSVRAAFPDVPEVHVRERAGQTKAHYEVATATIAIPLQSMWAAREAVVLHELSHHLNSRGEVVDDWHGPDYRLTMCTLVACVLGPAAALLLRAGYSEAGVPVPAVA
jgi:putative metallohydrolase (TIGR04338 family)